MVERLEFFLAYVYLGTRHDISIHHMVSPKTSCKRTSVRPSTMAAHMAQSNKIVVSGAREHNLKDISLELPRDALVVITGLSGSGKSSLAFDTIYAEGQRRYV